MIKIANNLVKLAEKVSDETKEKKKGRKVDYKGRALKGGLMGALAGGLGGAGVAAIRNDEISNLLLGGGAGALLGGGIGALGHMLTGYGNEDIITRQDEPNRVRRGLLGSIVPGLYGAAVGGGLGLAGDLAAKENVSWRTGLGGLGGALLGGGIGALGGGVIDPWMNADYYGQEGENEVEV
jgi:hypothetical protein